MEKHKNKCFNVFQNKRLILVFFSDCGSGGGIACTLSDCLMNGEREREGTT